MHQSLRTRIRKVVRQPTHPALGLDKLCQHNFENNRRAKELRIIPRIIGSISRKVGVVVSTHAQFTRSTRGILRKMASCSSSSETHSSSGSATDSSVSKESSSTNPEAESLLQRLRAPRPSELARKRVVKSNPPIGRKRCRGRCDADPKNVTVADR